MSNQTARAWIICALGSFVGALIGLQVTHAWWGGLIAAIVGFIVGYPAYDFKQVIAAARTAFRFAREEFRSAYNDISRWRPDREAWKLRFESYAYWICWGVSLEITWRVSHGPWGSLVSQFVFVAPGTLDNITLVNMFSILLWACIGVLLLPSTWSSYSTHESMKKNLSEVATLTRWITLACNPILWAVGIIIGSRPDIQQTTKTIGASALTWLKVILGWLKISLEFALAATAIYLSFRYRKTISKLCHDAWRFGWTFSKLLFHLIHSDMRLLYGVDTAIGAAIGFYCGNASLGAIVGGCWAAFNIEIFSIRVLKLIPIEQSLFRW